MTRVTLDASNLTGEKAAIKRNNGKHWKPSWRRANRGNSSRGKPTVQIRRNRWIGLLRVRGCSRRYSALWDGDGEVKGPKRDRDWEEEEEQEEEEEEEEAENEKARDEREDRYEGLGGGPASATCRGSTRHWNCKCALWIFPYRGSNTTRFSLFSFCTHTHTHIHAFHSRISSRTRRSAPFALYLP